MTDIPLAVCLLTYKRTYEALETVFSTCEHLKYPRELIRWYVADDGSPDQHHHAILQALEKNGMALIGEHNEKFRTDGSYNCGAGWNKGLGICHQYSDFVLWLEDDWRMEADLDMMPYIRLLQENEKVGIITFRILSTGGDVHTVGWNGEVFLQYKRTTQYAYSGNPLLRHARYTKRYGWIAEDRSPGLIELHQDDKYRYADDGTIRTEDDGPQIWRPATLDQWGGWHHVGTEKTWE